ncbi:MAG TPA: cytochrome P450 [Acidimicrobiales bacterium]|jgi:cytochrome P450 family 142 subfamily A polypeptide 1|nr:cytochrome P450 [Acidimicrobiales bacterium]
MADTVVTKDDLPTPPFDLDVLDPRFYDDPWDGYRWLRNHAPVWWDPRNELWVVSKHEDVSYVSRNDDLFSAAQGVRPKLMAPMSIIAMDDPEHTRQRRLVSKGFTPRVVRQLSDHIRDLSRELIDSVAAKGEVEFVEDFAIHVPLIVIAEMMGLDPEQRKHLYHWSDDMMAGDGHTDPESPALLAAAVAFGEFCDACSVHIDERRRTGRTDDIIGILTNAFDDGELGRGGMPSVADEATATAVSPLSNDDLLMFLTLLVVAGNETTRNALSGGLHALSRFPDQRARLVAEPELMETAVDEIVRFVSPVLSFNRTLTRDHVYKGVQLCEGDKVLMLYQSANRDEDVFDRPDDLILDRDPNPSLAFGVGTHFCMGYNLAKAEIRIVYEELFARLRDISAVDPSAPLERGDSSLVMSIKRLPARFTPEREGRAPQAGV